MRVQAFVAVVVAGVLLVANACVASAAANGVPPPGLHDVTSVPARVQPALLFNAGSEVLVFGTNPNGNSNAGALYSRTSGRWRSMPPAPFDPVMRLPSGVWTGRELVVVGLECDPRKSDDEGSCTPGTFVGASYTPKVNQWRKLRIPAEIAAGYHPGDVIGTAHALGWSAERAVFQVNTGTWAFDPERDRWEHLPESAASSCATKRRLVSLG